MRPAPPPPLFQREVRRLHCVGMGGMGLGPLAVYLAQVGFEVSGEDDAFAAPMRAVLEREGVKITPPGGIPAGAELVVCSSAIAPSHPARAAALARGLPLVRRGELLAEVLHGKKLVAVCGSHGKTTTTALLITALRRANFPAGWVLGGLFADDAVPPARAGSSDWVVAEIDESDGTINAFAPEITLATNLDWDHPDHYRRLDDLVAAFAALFTRTKSAVLTSDACALSQRITAEIRQGGGHPQFFTFGRSGDFACDLAGETDAHLRLRLGGRFPALEAAVRARGEFNAANAAAALAAAQLIGVEPASRLLADYAGVRRRQSVLSSAPDLTVIEDYAHHPAEIRALLLSLRRRVEERGWLIVVFQPHRFSRTAQFKTEFAAALALADRVHLLDVYPAGEAPIAGGTTADIYAELRKNAASLAVDYLPGDDTALFRTLSRELRRGDLVAFVGAGDVDQKARAWLALRCADEMKAKTWDGFAAALRLLLSAGTRIVREEPLAAKTTMRVGGAARVYAEPATAEDLQILLHESRARGVEIFFLGRGSNLIVPDDGVDGLVITLAHEHWQRFELRPDGRIWAGAGLRLKNLCGLASRAGLVGFEFLEGIPGSVGGALRMNAGAMGGWIFDVVEEVEIMTPAGEVKTLRKADMHVAYRHCAELHDAIALGALLRPAAQADTEAISRQIDVYRRKRHETQPREPSAGCVFKNPPGNSAGRLIDEAGLKGERVGDAEVSPVHANFIVNRGHATTADIIALMRRVRARVREARGVELEPEVLLYGKKWEDVL